MIWKSLFAVFLGFIVLTSCLDDPEPVALDATPDVFMQKIVENDQEKTALAFWVLGNKAIESVTVEGPADGNWTLEQNNNSDRVFSLFPEIEDYTSSAPETGDYTFTVTSTQTDEEPLTLTDELGEEILEVPVIDTIEFENGKLKATWETVDGAESYLVRLFDEEGEQLYGGPQIGENETEFEFGLSDQGWLNPDNRAQAGEPYRLEILAILYESGTSSSNKEYNVQFISIASEEVIWDN